MGSFVRDLVTYIAVVDFGEKNACLVRNFVFAQRRRHITRKKNRTTFLGHTRHCTLSSRYIVINYRYRILSIYTTTMEQNREGAQLYIRCNGIVSNLNSMRNNWIRKTDSERRQSVNLRYFNQIDFFENEFCVKILVFQKIF